MSNFIYIMGKSSAGKDTIYQRLKDKITTNVYVPYTTRPMRDGEQDGREYHFVKKEKLAELQKQDKVMEFRSYNVKYEGKDDVWTYATVADEQWNKQGDFLTIGTLESYTSILEYLKEHPEKDLNMIPVYITIDEKERERRARKREENQIKPNYEEMERRLKADNIDFSEEKLKQAKIGDKQTFENYDLEKCVEDILKYVKRERSLTLQEKYKVDVLHSVETKQDKIDMETEERGISD